MKWVFLKPELTQEKTQHVSKNDEEDAIGPNAQQNYMGNL